MPHAARSLLLGVVLVLSAATARGQGQPTTLERIKQTGVLRWGADPSGGAPFCFNNPRDPHQVVGFEIELMALLARRMGVRPELVRGDWNSLIPSMEAGRIDVVLNGLEINEKRKDAVLFSTPYFRFAQQLSIRARDRDRYRNLDDLKGKKIAVLKGSAAEDLLLSQGWTKDEIIGFDDSLKPYDVLKHRRVEGVLCESIIANYYAGTDSRILILPATFDPGEYALALRKTDPDLLVEINRHLEDLKKSGELGELYQRWDLWNDQQEELGIVKGRPQPVDPLAHRVSGLNGETLLQIGKELLEGAGYTLLLTAVSMPLALLFGLGLALLTRARRWWWRLPAQIYIQIIRGTPLLVQVFVIYFSLPYLDEVLDLGGWLVWPELAVGILCLSANYAAYEAEIHRAGLEAVPRGQREAALALGMTERQAFLYVIFPQSFRIILPPVINDLVSMLKDSCIVSVIGVGELLYVAQSIGKSTFMHAQMLLAAAFLYLVMSMAADFLGKRLEARLKQSGTTPVAGHAPRH